MRGRRLLLAAIFAPAALAIACSASNGDAIPSEVRDAEALDVGSNDPTKRDGASTDDDSGAKDGSIGDASSDVASDAKVDGGATSAAARINEVYAERTNAGAKAEYIEIRGPAGIVIDDLYVRVIDANGVPSSGTAYSVANAGTKMPASGVWLIGGFGVSPLPDTIVSIPDGWNLDESGGAIQLLRGSGPTKDVIDVVGWTDDPDGGAAPQPALPPKATVEGTPFVLPKTGTTSFGRTANAADTNDNAKDFCLMNSSPRAANGACL